MNYSPKRSNIYHTWCFAASTFTGGRLEANRHPRQDSPQSPKAHTRWLLQMLLGAPSLLVLPSYLVMGQTLRRSLPPSGSSNGPGKGLDSLRLLPK